MVRVWVVIILLSMVIGCAPTKQITVPVEVSLPVVVEPPQPPMDAFELLELPIHTITEQSTDEDVGKAYAVTVKILQGFVLKLQKYLEAYKK